MTNQEKIEILDEGIAKRRVIQEELKAKSFEAHANVEKFNAELKAIPLFERIIHYKKYNYLRDTIKEYQNIRFGYVAMMMSNTREILRFEKAKRIIRAKSNY